MDLTGFNGIIFNLKGFIFICSQFNIFLISGAGVTESISFTVVLIIASIPVAIEIVE